MCTVKEPHLHLLQGHKLDQAAHDGAGLRLPHVNLLNIQAAGGSRGDVVSAGKARVFDVVHCIALCKVGSEATMWTHK